MTNATTTDPSTADRSTADRSGKTVAFLVANEGIEQVELTAPWDAVVAAGGHPVLIAPKQGEVQAFHHLDRGDVFQATMTTAEADPGAFAAIVLPGGVANPDQLRLDQPAVDFIADFARTSKPIAAICHGSWTLAEAGVVRGRRMTSWPSLRTDLRNAGADWVDEQVVVDTNGPGALITSRKPDDLDAFCAAVVERI